MFVLCNVIIAFILGLVDGIAGLDSARGEGPLGALYTLAVFLPGLALSVRRLHDIGKSGWTMLLPFIPFIGGIILLLFLVRDSEPGQNAYGPNPKQVAS